MTEKYQENWDSLIKYEVPEWFMNAKFGIFIHWGAYSVPAYESEWYSRLMYLHSSAVAREWETKLWDIPGFYNHHVKTWGDPGDFGYKDFIPLFKGENWNPEEWVSLFKQAGARYVVPVGEHHDGFPMYKTQYSNWNAAEMGPKRDVCMELRDAVKAKGLHFGISTHRANCWNFFSTTDKTYDLEESAGAGLYWPQHRKIDTPESPEFLKDWFLRTKEIVDRFSPELLFFDIGWHREGYAPYRPKVAAYYYNHALEHGYNPVLNYKKTFPAGTAVLDRERAKLDDISEHYWQTDTSVSYKSWCHVENEAYKSPEVIIHDLADIVSKNGNLLLNVGPRADGTISEEIRWILLEIGSWLEINGDAIYDTSPFLIHGEGPTPTPVGHLSEGCQQPYSSQDFRFTTKGDDLYITALGWPDSGKLHIKSLGLESGYYPRPINSVSMGGCVGDIKFERLSNGLTILLPDKKPCDYAWTFKLN
jgi:alpha-L-fucosidase